VQQDVEEHEIIELGRMEPGGQQNNCSGLSVAYNKTKVSFVM
jgi:hypothetical protein